MPDNYYGYKVRQNYPGEDAYFKENPTTAGMATDDGKIIFNPYSEGVNRDAVGRNEAIRLWLRKNDIDLKFKVTPSQRERFKGTPYEGNDKALRRTILSRIASGDPSAGDVTGEQKKLARFVLEEILDGMGGW